MANKSNIIKNLMKKYNRPFYIYDKKIISHQIETLTKNFKNFEFLYSIKTNPYLPIIKYISSKGFGSDSASSQEVLMSYEAGIPSEKIFYSSPGKTRSDIEKTLDKSTIIADSYNELVLINDIAKENNLILKIGLRINPDYNMDGENSKSSKFGIDEETLIDNKIFFDRLNNIEITGIHVHLRSQILDYTKLYLYYEKVFELGLFCKDKLEWKLEFINFGSGLGVPYSLSNDRPLDIKSLGDKCEILFEKFKNELNIRLIIESGRFLVCESGSYVTKIVDIKESRGKKYVIVENSLNGFFKPSISEFLSSYLPLSNSIKSYEPLFTSIDAFEFNIIKTSSHVALLETVDIVGNLCTSADIMAKDITIIKPEIGDLIVVSKAGSYAYSLSPLLFSSHQVPLQFLLDPFGEIYHED